MATICMMKHPVTGIYKKGFVGFSWTALFFGPFPALFRKDWLEGLVDLALLVGLLLYMDSRPDADPYSRLSFDLVIPICFVLNGFNYNRRYTKKLLNNGYVFADAEPVNKLAAAALGVDYESACGHVASRTDGGAAAAHGSTGEAPRNVQPVAGTTDLPSHGEAGGSQGPKTEDSRVGTADRTERTCPKPAEADLPESLCASLSDSVRKNGGSRPCGRSCARLILDARTGYSVRAADLTYTPPAQMRQTKKLDVFLAATQREGEAVLPAAVSEPGRAEQGAVRASEAGAALVDKVPAAGAVQAQASGKTGPEEQNREEKPAGKGRGKILVALLLSLGIVAVVAFFWARDRGYTLESVAGMFEADLRQTAGMGGKAGSLLGGLFSGGKRALSKEAELYSKQLLDTAEHGSVGEVTALLEKGADVNYLGERNWTPLKRACGNQDPEVARVLIRAGADVNEKRGMYFPLMKAAQIAVNPKVIDVLVQAGAVVNAKKPGGYTALYLAFANDTHEVFDRLLACGADVNVGYRHDPEYVRGEFSCSELVDEKTAGKYCSPEPEGMTLLMYAILLKDHNRDIGPLIRAGGDVNAKNSSGMTPLMYAAMGDADFGVCKQLVDAGADVRARDNAGSTVLHYAVRHTDNWPFFNLLLKKGADVNARNRSGRTPLMAAAFHAGSARLIMPLVQHGARVEEADNEGKTALMFAAASNPNAAVFGALLMDAGASVKARDKSGKSVMDYMPRK